MSTLNTMSREQIKQLRARADWDGDVIDLGCGSGTMLQQLLRYDRSGSKTITGIDYSDAAIARCRQLLPQGKFLKRDLCQTGLEDASFDLVLSMQTMEHLPQPADAMREMWRLMRTGSRLVITIPNGAVDTWKGHCNFWTPDSFIAMAGRTPQRVDYFNERRNLLFVFHKG